jgi:dihydroflavonol-4-reductase
MTINLGAVFGTSLLGNFSSSRDILRDLYDGKFPMIPNVGFEIVDVRDVAILHRLAFEAPDATGK